MMSGSRFTIGVLTSAALAGIAVGGVLSFREAPPASAASVTGNAQSGAVMTFGYCKWGGGTNCVVDGDTFYMEGEKIRIADIDAPETHEYRCASELELGNRATERLHELLNSGAITMTSIDRDEDVYGRKLRNVQVNRTDVGEMLIGEGLAHRYVHGKLPWC